MTGTTIPKTNLSNTPHSSAVLFPASLAVGDDVDVLAVLVPLAVLPMLPTLLVSDVDVVDTVVVIVDVVDTAEIPVVTLVDDLLAVVGVASGELATHWALGHLLQSSDSTTWHSSLEGQAGHVGITSGQMTHPLCRGRRTTYMYGATLSALLWGRIS